MRRKYRAMRIDAVKATQPNQDVTVGGLITAVRTHYTKKGEPILFLTLEDTSGTCSATCFTKTTSEFGKYLLKDAIVVLRGKAQHRERMSRGGSDAAAEDEAGGGGERAAQVEVIVNRVEQIVPNAMAADARPREVHVRIDPSTKTLLKMLRDTFAAREGGSPLFLRVETPDGVEQKIKTPLLVDADEALIEQVRRMLGGGTRRAWVE